MKNVTLEDVTQEEFDAAAETIAAGVKAYNRRLDTRDGTVLRDLLVNPDAAVGSVMSAQVAEVRKCTSLKRLGKAQEEGLEVDQEDVDAILSNFNLKPTSGSKSKGIVKIVVSDGSSAYSVSEGALFTTIDGLSFLADEQIVATLASEGAYPLNRNTDLYKGAAGYFFLVPVTASESGSAGNIGQGTAITPSAQLPAFVMAEAYKDFCGGSDVQSIGEVMKGITSGLSIRGFVSKTAAEGMLRDEFDDGDHPIVAVSAVGYGNAAQRRDRHNVFGVGVGGRIDLYVRNFTDAYTVTKTLSGNGGNGSYSIDVPPGTFPGACWIKSVADPFNPVAMDENGNVLESLAFTARRTADISGTWHDIDPRDADVEAFNTVWQGFSLSLEDVPPDIAASDSGSDEPGWSETRDFKVTAYCLPQATELQEYVDREDVRSVSTDVVVRCPIMCRVSVNATVTYDSGKPMDVTSARSAIRSYVNNLGFVGRITRSEIVQILKNMGAYSVEMPSKDMLYGELHDAKGELHSFSGDAIDISTQEDGPAMLSGDTVVFVADERDIQVKAIPNQQA